MALIATVTGVLAWADVVHWRSSRRGITRRSVAPPITEAVVVLGYRNRGSRANHLNRYRVRAGLRSLDPRAGSSVLVLCGGRVGGEIAESVLMAQYARSRRGYRGAIRLDTESTTTWENIRYAIPLIEGADSIKIVSNSLHAEKARVYLRNCRPDLARRVRRAAEHRWGEIALLKPLAAVVGLRSLRSVRAAVRPAAPTVPSGSAA